MLVMSSARSAMAFSARVSLKHEYEQFVEREIEDYKDRVPRSAILSIAEEAVQRLHKEEQVTLNELVLWIEVDRIIAARLRLPAYQSWARKRRKQLEQLRRPEAWGLDPNAALARNVPTAQHAHVLVAQLADERAALFLAANGCTVTAVEPEPDIIARIVKSADEHGLLARVNMVNEGLDGFAPPAQLAAFVCSRAALEILTPEERSRVLGVLQRATQDGGVHLVEIIAAGTANVDLDELRRSYAEWDVSIEEGRGLKGERTFIARKTA
jgi:hypothetical protein